jgi:hypothetical protein
MSFLHPAFLWALLALAIPVFIHLFQLRRFKRIDFPNVRFLAEVSQQTRARKKVQHWAVLLARCLAITALVLAFAQPYIPGADGVTKVGQRAVSLFIDDSFSMDGQNAQGRLLDQARKAAQDAVMAYAPTDRFQVLTGRFEGREQVLLGRDEALEAAAQVDASAFVRPLSQVLVRQREALARSEAPVKRAFLFTDLQRTTTDVSNWSNDSLVPTVIVPIAPGKPDNLSIDSAWFDTPVRRMGQQEILHVRVRNHGDQELVNVPLRLAIDGRQRAIATFSVQPGSVVDTTLRFTSDRGGSHTGVIAVDDQPVVFDDQLWIAYRVVERSHVMLVSGGDAQSDRSVADVFLAGNGDSLHVFTSHPHRSLDLALLEQQDLVILNALPDVASGLAQALNHFVENGGSVVVFPPSRNHGAGSDPARYAALFAQFGAAPPALMDTALARVDRIDLDKPFFRDIFERMQRNVDLPVARERWSLRPAAGSDVLLRMQDGSPYLSRTPHGKGSVYLCASPLDERAGNFTRHAFFITSLLRMAELSRPRGSLYHTIGAEVSIPLDGVELPGEAVPRLIGPEGIDLVPEVRRTPGGTGLVLHDQDLPSGAYAVLLGTDTLMTLALNTARLESDLRTLTAAELEAQLQQHGLTTFSVLTTGTHDLSLRLSELDQGRKLWKWFILLALLSLAAEVLLIRYLR